MWELIILFANGTSAAIVGSEEVMRTEVLQWQDYENRFSEEAVEHERRGTTYLDPEGFKVRLVEGLSGCASRRQQTTAFRYAEVVSMSLTEL